VLAKTLLEDALAGRPVALANLASRCSFPRRSR